MNNLFACRVSNATVSGSLISNLFRASNTQEILPGPLQSSFSNTFYADYPSCAGFTPKRSSEYDGVLEFLPNIDVSPGQCGQCGECPSFYKAMAIFVRIKKKRRTKKTQYKKTTLFCRLLAQTTLRNILGTKNLHEILSDRESISSSMQVVFLFFVVFLFVFARKVVGQFGTNM